MIKTANQLQSSYNKEELAHKYLPLVPAVAASVSHLLPQNSLVDFDELCSVGYHGLARALECFRVRENNNPYKYFRRHIYGSMLDFLRRIDVCGRVVRKKIKWIERRKMILEQELGRYATMEEVKEYCDLDAMDAELINGDRIVHASSCSLNYHRYAREDEESFACHEIQEGLAAPFTHPAEVMDRKELRERFEKVLTGLSPKLRQTIILFYFEGLRQSEIGKKLGVSGEAIYLRRRDALKILRQETSFCDYA